jgi:hypothetical protein
MLVQPPLCEKKATNSINLPAIFVPGMYQVLFFTYDFLKSVQIIPFGRIMSCGKYTP